MQILATPLDVVEWCSGHYETLQNSDRRPQSQRDNTHLLIHQMALVVVLYSWGKVEISYKEKGAMYVLLPVL